MKQIGKRVYNNNFFKYWGDTVPLKNNLSFYSKNRIGSTVVNKIDDSKNGKLVYNPLTDVIDLEKWGYDPSLPESQKQVLTIKSVVTTWNGTSGTWDETIEDVDYTIIRNFADFQAINIGNGTSGSYIMANDIDCSASCTTKPVSSDGLSAWVSGGEYENLDKVLVGTDIYIKTAYIEGYDNTVSPELDTEEKYWHIYNYEGFWIDTFSGVFSGNGFELQNCYVNKVTPYAGVFSYLSGGKLSNIGVSGSVIGYGESVGGLVGRNFTSSTITNSYSTGSVIGYSTRVGGLVGYNRNSSIITNSYSTGSVIGYSTGVGGLVGYNYSSSITNSYSTGSVIGYSEHTGGLVGYNRNSSIITNSYSTGSVIGYGAYVGGLVGYNYSSSITNSYSTGSVIGYGLYVGGLVGNNYSSSIITNSYYSSLSGQTDTGKGLLVPDTDMKGIDNIDTFVDWDFTNIWAIDDSYPYLRMQVDNLANPISNSRIVNNYDGYVLMPSDIEIESGKPLFNRDDTDIYNQDATSVETGYVGDGTGGESSYYWHISELNTATILSYMNNDYKNSWFVKNTFDGSEVKTVKEILAYNAPITNADDLTKIMKYLRIGE